MFKKIIAVLTLVSFIVSLVGCHAKPRIPVEEIEQYHNGYTIAKVVTVDGEIIEFTTSKSYKIEGIQGWKKPVLKDDRIEGFAKDGTFKTIPLEQVKMIYMKKFSTWKTVGLVMGLGLITAALAYIGYLIGMEAEGT